MAKQKTTYDEFIESLTPKQREEYKKEYQEFLFSDSVTNPDLKIKQNDIFFERILRIHSIF